MNYLGMQISVVEPVRITRTELVEVKNKVGPRRVRKQKIKVFVRWQEVLEDGKVIKFAQANALQMNQATYAQLRKAIEAEQKKALGIPSEFLGPAMRGAL
ncbi:MULTISPECIES: hypothetical protein [unclassified Neptuniibacter]|uniref:hypothetical protein n=1 Tax=unclassified Neptuniibacter TaxID=2630693 RepID=UPI000C437339|nr:MULTISPECIES: hypothetical protein [unclassified Neptuniibacter]MAY41693.1 hypothetical protein [Oceanospirillaceae bacterium]|tara:strand:- start:3249 stop:3548 length:300 start_codon:yes stop_codon:yes gene_type:complete